MQTRSLILGLALVAGGTIIGATTQHLASAAVSSGERAVLIPITPCRLADTRPTPNTVGPRSAPLAAGDTHVIDVRDTGTPCDGLIPNDASALSLNITALGATGQSFLTVWSDGTRPKAASLNPAANQPPVPNAVTTAITSDQEFRIYNDAATVNVVVDVNGYYIDHDHDDRYYTETEADTEFLNQAEADARYAPTRVVPDSIEYSIFDLQLTGPWEPFAGLETAGGPESCAQMTIDDDLLDGRFVSSVDIAYSANAAATANMGVVGLINTAGTFPTLGVPHYSAANAPMPGTAAGEIGSVRVFGAPLLGGTSYDPIDGAGHDTVFQFCTVSKVVLVGLTINFSTMPPPSAPAAFGSSESGSVDPTVLLPLLGG